MLALRADPQRGPVQEAAREYFSFFSSSDGTMCERLARFLSVKNGFDRGISDSYLPRFTRLITGSASSGGGVMAIPQTTNSLPFMYLSATLDGRDRSILSGDGVVRS